MESLKEKINYKGTISICMKDIVHMEQYEVIRYLLSYNKDYRICKHNAVDGYITAILEKLQAPLFDCSEESVALQKFGHLTLKEPDS